ncbi:serine/threonine-protein kinase [Tengunoibacter tsumagoiensis]|uniref:non-specific serine/threonine protein kinase n=1 Tax=Tengunoibacter tsumagoiensis TaxID=2014871 RepID=A0A401ZWT9_9CHLR|nr:serine/threonine-protein kinase [Tengunoibacter tsumagoiensis]GCE11391.1 hypothetical protein KTT_12500 [Tengunoibacter tsumagoiensis]
MSTAPRRLGKYELQQSLGRGQVGEVWKARDVSIHQEVALKIIHSDLQSDPHFMKRFTDEGQVISLIRHTNLVPVREYLITRTPQTNETIACIVMEYVEGQTLAHYLQGTSHRGYIPAPAAIVYLTSALASGIDMLHGRGIIHGNIKPANVLLNLLQVAHFDAGEPQLTDAGISQIVNNTSMTTTPAYVSPEQAAGDPVNQRSDIYALGVMLYEICTGMVPFRGDSSVAIMMQHINALPTPPILINSSIPAALSEVILRALAKNPATRFSSAAHLAAAVAEACSLQTTFHINRPQTFENEPHTQNSTVPNSILGVSQPLPPLYPMRPIVPQNPLSQISRPLPAVSKQLSQPLPAVNYQASQPVSDPQAPASIPAPALPAPAPQTPPVEKAEAKPVNEREKEQSANKDQWLTGQLGTSGFSSSTKPSSNRFNLPSQHGLTGGRSQQPSIPPVPPQRQAPEQQPQQSSSPYYPAVPPMQPAPQNAQQYPPNPAGPSYGSMPSLAPIPTLPPAQPAQGMPHRPAPPRKKSGFLRFADSPIYLVIGVLVIVLLVLFSALGANLLLDKQTANQQPTPVPPLRQVFFQDSALGHSDQLHISINTVAAPPDGKTYFAWLQESSDQVIPLGAMDVQKGSIDYTYAGDDKHTNLLAITKGIFITLEEGQGTPTKPANQKVFQALLNPASLPILKKLLYADGDLPTNPAVINGLFDSIKNMNDKAVSIVDSLQNSHDTGLARRQATRIIEAVDGSAYARSSGDLPASFPSQISVPIGLLSSTTQAGYIDTLDKELDNLKQVPGNSAATLQHIQNIKNAITDLRTWIQKIRDYDVKILKATDLTDPDIIQTALQQKQTVADSYTGHTIPPNEGPLPILGSAGANQAYTEGHYLATIDLQAVS